MFLKLKFDTLSGLTVSRIQQQQQTASVTILILLCFFFHIFFFSFFICCCCYCSFVFVLLYTLMCKKWKCRERFLKEATIRNISHWQRTKETNTLFVGPQNFYAKDNFWHVQKVNHMEYFVPNRVSFSKFDPLALAHTLISGKHMHTRPLSLCWPPFFLSNFLVHSPSLSNLFHFFFRSVKPFCQLKTHWAQITERVKFVVGVSSPVPWKTEKWPKAREREREYKCQFKRICNTAIAHSLAPFFLILFNCNAANEEREKPLTTPHYMY